MRYRSILVALPVLLLFMATKAQLSESDTLHWGARLTLSGSLSTGNVNRFLLAQQAEITHLSKHRRTGLRTHVQYMFGTFGGRKTEDDLLVRQFFYLNPRARLYPFAMVWWEKNYRRQLDFGWQWGTGLSAVLWKDSLQLMKISATLLYEKRQFNGVTYNRPAYNGSGDIELWRATLRLYGENRIRHWNVRYEAYWQPGLGRQNNQRWRLEGSLGYRLNTALSLRIQTAWMEEQVVLSGVRTHDFFLTYGLTVGNF